jgi:L-threonylcarbamoyladenylate synthase
LSDGRTTRVLAGNRGGTALAGSIIRSGGLVAFPTETVYGLGANALDERAVASIFAAKRRPTTDPLIVHLADAATLAQVAQPADAALLLADRFWPGPLTLVLPKQPSVPANVTAGLETVAVRVPAHALARAIIAAAGVPVAAPSANLFGRPSPTRAEHVLADLGGRIDAVVDGGPTPVGVESTIVDLTGQEPRLLRPGGLPSELVEAALGRALVSETRAASMDVAQAAPGLLESHYAPRTRLVLVVGSDARPRLEFEVRSALERGERVGVLLLDEDRPLVSAGVTAASVGSQAEPETLAARLFDALRSLDSAGLDVLYARELADPEHGLGRALADRLRRAASRVIAT